MAGRHLRELLGEEQEPFALQSFIVERQSRGRLHLTKSPFWPGPGASRVQKLGKKDRRFFQKRKSAIEEDSRRSFGSSFLASFFSRLVLRKQRHRVIRREEEKATSEEAQKKDDDEEVLQSVEPTPPPSPTRPPTKENLGEEKEEQYSPVSVLDPPHSEEEDDDAQEHEEEEDDDEETSSFHKTKRDLLRRIRRFESLADLGPPQLDRRLAGEDENDAGGKLGFRRGLEEIVEMDMRGERSDEWRRFPDQVAELAAVFSSLLASELAEDFIRTFHLD